MVADGEKWHYLAVKQVFALLTGIKWGKLLLLKLFSLPLYKKNT